MVCAVELFTTRELNALADEFAVRSQERAAAAWENGVMRETVVPLTVFSEEGWRLADRDEFLRPETTMEDGYTFAGPVPPGPMIGVVLQNWTANDGVELMLSTPSTSAATRSSPTISTMAASSHIRLAP